MKKVILIILTIVVCLSVAASLSACKKKITSESETAGQESVEQSKEYSEKQSEGKSESETAATSESIADDSESMEENESGSDSESIGESESVSESESIEESEEEREIVYSEGLEYELTSDGNAYAVKGAGTFTGSELNIPSEHDGKPVTSILRRAFTDSTGITSICIPDTITTIEEESFNNYCELSNIYFEGNIVSWCNVNGLENLPLYQTFRKLYFKGKELKGILTIPKEATIINAAAFAACDEITEVVIAEGITKIGLGAFIGCNKLTNVTINKGITHIEEYAFTSCENLAKIDYIGDLASWCKIDGLVNIPDTANLYIDGKEIAGKLVLPDTVTEIKNGAFFSRSKLTSVTIPDSVTSIGNNAFYNCLRITTVKIGNSAASIGSGAFLNCINLISVTIGDNVTNIGDSAFGFCAKLTNIKIPNNIISIGGSAFSGCSGLTNITIPNTLTNLGDYAFSGCSGLTSITIPDSVTNIGNNVFSDCKGLTSAVVPAEAVSGVCPYNIEELIITSGKILMLWDFNALNSITIGDNVTDIERNAFSRCPNLNTIQVSENNKYFNAKDNILYNGAKIIFAVRGLQGNVTIPDGITDVGISAFENCIELTGVIIPNSVTVIEDNAFLGCERLTEIILPNSVTHIGFRAFGYCRNLESLTIPDNLTDIDNEAFWECNNLKKANLPASAVKYISRTILETVVLTVGEISYGFSDCSSLKNVEIRDGVTAIGNDAFWNCSELANLTIGKNVTKIGDSAFNGCGKLDSVTIPKGIINIGKGAFARCNLTNVYYDGDLTSWCKIDGLDGLLDCDPTPKNLYISGKEITGKLVLPDGITTIKSCAFYGRNGITSVTIPDSITNISWEAFYGCSKLTEFIYKGTKGQWIAITKGSSWDYNTGNYVVHCTDGDINKN